MSNILIYYGAVEVTNIMMTQFFEKLCEVNKIGLRSKLSNTVTTNDLTWSDVVINIRGQGYLDAKILELAKLYGRYTVCGYDDDFLAIPGYLTARKLSAKAIIKILQSSMAILSGNDNIFLEYKKFNKNLTFIHIDTMVEEKEIYLRKIEENIKEKKIAYYVNDGSTTEFNTVIIPFIKAFPDLANKYKWYFFSLQPNLDNLIKKENIVYVPHMSLEDFRAYLRKEDFTFGIAPLTESRFSRGKYFNKYMEYGTASIPCIFSNVLPYTKIVENMKDGILVDNTITDWKAGFELMDDNDLRKKIVSNMQEKIRNNFSCEAIISKFEKQNASLIQWSAVTKVSRLRLIPIKIIGVFVEMYGLARRPFVRLKERGFRNLIIYIFFRYIKRRKSFKEM